MHIWKEKNSRTFPNFFFSGLFSGLEITVYKSHDFSRLSMTVRKPCFSQSDPRPPYVLCPSFTAPCRPSQLNVSVDCANSSAVLGWSGSPNAVSYAGRAVGADGHNVTCDTGTELGCQLDELHCGTTYTFTVSASDGDCRSPDSEPVVQSTGERHLLLFSSSFSLMMLITLLFLYDSRERSAFSISPSFYKFPQNINLAR